MPKDLFEPMSVDEFLGLTLPEEFGKKRRYVPVCLGGMGESGMNFFAPDETHRDVGISQSAEKIRINYKTGGKRLELEAYFTRPTQAGEALPPVKIARVRISSYDSPEHFSVTCFSREPAATAAAAAEKPSLLGGLFRKLSRRRGSLTNQTKELTEKRINVALHVISHAYSSIVQDLVPEVGPDHPVFSDDAEPNDPPLKLRNINAGALAAMKRKGSRP